MSVSWQTAQKSLVELQKVLSPAPLIVEYINKDGVKEHLTVEELLKIPNPDCQIVKVVSGNSIKEVEKVLDWELQSIKCVIE